MKIKATKKEIMDFIKDPLMEGDKIIKFYTYEEGKYILETYILPIRQKRNEENEK